MDNTNACIQRCQETVTNNSGDLKVFLTLIAGLVVFFAVTFIFVPIAGNLFTRYAEWIDDKMNR